MRMFAKVWLLHLDCDLAAKGNFVLFSLSFLIFSLLVRTYFSVCFCSCYHIYTCTYVTYDVGLKLLLVCIACPQPFVQLVRYTGK